MRIKEPSAKVGYLLVVVVGVTLTTIPLSTVSFELGLAWAMACVIAAIVVAARTFRGATEPDSPRPWWKMTSARGSGGILSAMFFVQAATTLWGTLPSPDSPLLLVSGIASLIIAGFYLNSAIRIGPAATSA